MPPSVSMLPTASAKCSISKYATGSPITKRKSAQVLMEPAPFPQPDSPAAQTKSLQALSPSAPRTQNPTPSATSSMAQTAISPSTATTPTKLGSPVNS